MERGPVNPGDILAGKYRVERVLGQGGMGVVVAATHLDLLEPRALKFILPGSLSDPDAAPRFLREARASARLKSEHVAKVLDTGRLENGAPYMVMEYLEGSPLDAIIKNHGSLSVPVVSLYAIQVCAALAEAHAAGIVHRDLKPANLFLTRRPDGTPCVKVLDFGISKVMNPGVDFDVTKTQQVLGSPFYMSPEQMKSSKQVDARSDIWSLGVILYKLSTGKVPFAATNITELVAMVLEASPTPPGQLVPGMPRGFEAAIMRCLRRNRDERFPNVVELAMELLNFAPSGTAPVVEAMNRVFAAGSPMGRSGTFSAPPEEPQRTSASLGQTALPPAQTSFTAHGASPPGSSSSPSINAPAADATTKAWGRTGSRINGRGGLPMMLGLIGGLIVLAGGIGVAMVVRKPSEADTGTAAAAVTHADPANVAGAPSAKANDDAPPPPTVTPAMSASETGPAREPASKATAAPKVETPSKPTTAPASAPAPAKDASSPKGKSGPSETAPPPKKTILNGEPIF